MKIVLIAEHGPKIGGGHLSRLCSISEWLSDYNFDLYLCSNSTNSPLITTFRQMGVSIHIYENLNVLLERSIPAADFYIIDGDHIPDALELKLREKNQCQIIRISDQPVNYKNADFLINQNLGSETFDYQPINGQIQKFGLQQLMLPNSVRLAKGRNAHTSSIDNVVVSLGNSKSSVVTKILNGLIATCSSEAFGHIKFQFFVAEQQHILDCSSFDNISIHPLTKYFTPVMQQADLLISSVGSTMWEAMALDLPFSAIPLNDQQREYALLLSTYNICNILEKEIVTQGGEGCFKLIQNILNIDIRMRQKESFNQFLPSRYFSWLAEILHI